MKHKRNNRILYFARASIVLNVLLVLGKIGMGLLTLSYFLCINALYNAGIALTKYLAVRVQTNVDKFDSTVARAKSNACYSLVGILILVFSAVYMLYCVRVFVGHADFAEYPIPVALVIAGFTFTEIGMSLHGAVVMRRDREPMIEALKLTNFATSLISLALTQTAILSVTLRVGDDPTFWNGICGVVFSLCAALIGLYMLIHMSRIKNGKYEASLLSRMRRALKGTNLELVRFADVETSPVILYYRGTVSPHLHDAVLTRYDITLEPLTSSALRNAPSAAKISLPGGAAE